MNEDKVYLNYMQFQACNDCKKQNAANPYNYHHMSQQDKRIANMLFGSVYPLYLIKVEKKGRTKKELDEVIAWLTGYDAVELDKLIETRVNFEDFFDKAKLTPQFHLITGMICGYRIEAIDNPLTRKVRALDKLVDELAKGRKMEKIMRK